MASATPALESITVEWHGPSRPIVDQLIGLGYDCGEAPGGPEYIWCSYPGAGTVCPTCTFPMPMGVGIQDVQDVQLVALLTDERERVGEVLEAFTDPYTTAWALNRLDVLVSYLQPGRSSQESPGDGLPSCRTLDTGVVDLVAQFDGETPILGVALRSFDQLWVANQGICPDQPILQPGAAADSACEEAIVAYLTALADDEGDDVARRQLFATCTRAELEAFNSKLTNDWQMNWAFSVDSSCYDSPDTKLCQSCPAPGSTWDPYALPEDCR